MDFRRRNEDDDDVDEDDDETVSYNNPPIICDSVFPKPLLPSSCSLIPGRSLSSSQLGGVRNGIRSEPSVPTRNASSDLSFPTSEGGKIQSSSLVNYRECLRNHAANLGGNILDGCGEFLPSSADAMKCAACGCHRSFHRRDGESSNLGNNEMGRIPLLLPSPQLRVYQKHIHSFSLSPSSGMARLGNTSGGTTTESSSEELGLAGAADTGGVLMPIVTPSSKKRFRTKFTSEQKVRMMDFAERIGWRIQRQDEAEIETFCAAVGVSRQVFKVWMHNNKHSIRRQQEQKHPQLYRPQNL